ncbi:MAG: transcriptional regulator, AraC family [Gammaproteobacteria bacterium]|nr:transcriptional regulator, AraC family [Gammaproteobacteria bacterium]
MAENDAMAKNALSHSERQRSRPHRVAMLVYPNVQILDVTGPLEVFARTARWLQEHGRVRQSAYEISLIAPTAGLVVSSGGLALNVESSYRQARSADTLLISGGLGYVNVMKDEALLDWIRGQARRVDRIGSICTGAMLLAAAGLLDGKRATTHWAYCSRLAALAPRAQIEPDALYVRTGHLYTSAGVTAGMDMALAMVEEDWGKSVSLAVAQELVMYLRRPGGQSQFSRHLQAEAREDRFGRLQLWMLEHIDKNLSVDQLAAHANLSVRHFAREFTAHSGVAPAAFVMRIRVEEARRLIEAGTVQLKGVARRCGFRDEQGLRRAFLRLLGVTPHDYRLRFTRESIH